MLKGRVACITGGSRGIGRAIALEFARLGANVAIIYQGDAKAALLVAADATESGVLALCYKADVSDYDSVSLICKQIAQTFGGVDILVNNAGITRDNLLLTMPEHDFDAVLAVNLKGVYNFTKHMSRYIIKSAYGRIINISSVSGITGNVGQANYAASKAGLIGLSKSVAKELAPRGVTVNCIAPGFIETDMTGGLPEHIKQAAISQIPLKKMGTSVDVAYTAAFLASDYASYITGQVISVSGGI